MLARQQFSILTSALFLIRICLATAIPTLDTGTGANHDTDNPQKQCKRTKVAVLGGGIAGITTAQTLALQNITDFLIIEYQPDIGGRVLNKPFGKGKDGAPYLVEFGANWVQGLGGKSGDGADIEVIPSTDNTENPIWTLEKQYNIKTVRSDFDRIKTYDESGEVDFRSEIEDYSLAVERLAAKGGEILENNFQDRTIREGLRAVGWKPEQRVNPAHAEAVEWWLYDGEQALTPEETSLVFNTAVSWDQGTTPGHSADSRESKHCLPRTTRPPHLELYSQHRPLVSYAKRQAMLMPMPTAAP